ncbi:MAG: VWA domain-containing protein [Phycisphaerales bacterium]|nr:VWA domain-containing protein [Phycisphaerales bacterium]
MVAAFELELTSPRLLLLALVALPLLYWYFRRSLVDFSRPQRIASLATRAVVLVLLILALSRPVALSPTREQFVVFAVDRSLSVNERAATATREFLDAAVKAGGANRAAFLPFAAEPGRVTSDLSQLDLSPPSATRPATASGLDSQGTNIAAALEVAAAAIPPFYVPKIVLLSDGNQTVGDALRAASVLKGVPVSTVALATRDDPEVQVSAVNAPAEVRQGEPFYVEVVVDSNQDENEGTVEVYRGPAKVISQKVKLKKGENRFRFQQSITRERVAEFLVRATGFKDTLLDNNGDTGLVFAAGKPRVLIVESTVKAARPLQRALEEEDIRVDVRPPEGMPNSLADLQNYEMLILSNVPATALTNRQMEIARSYVQDLGGGLAMLGGDQSFGLGGYYKTVLEEILPVRSDFEKEKQKPSLGMMIVIDKSGSMGGEKIELAKDAAKAAVELLGSNDMVGVLAFEGETFVISELQSAANKGTILDEISAIEAGGGTTMYPAMEQAFESLDPARVKLKHVIILTDGISEPGDFQGITASMAAAKITVSTVAVGRDSDQALLEEIAQTAGGRYYFTEDPASVPQIFARETMTASKSAINEQPFAAQVVRPTMALQGIDLTAAPFMLGYVVTRAKPTSEVILSTENGDPLLAWWRYGLGTSVAFTSDAKTRWAAEWTQWPGFSKFWAQVVRHAMRKNEAKGLVVNLTRRGSSAVLTADAADETGSYLNQAKVEATVIDPQMRKSTIALDQVAPGRYEARFDTPLQGAYHVELSGMAGGQSAFRQSRGLMVGYPDELRLRPTNRELLESIARVSGGAADAPAASAFAPTDREARRATPLWPYLLAIALVLLILDVALRRVDFELVLSRRPRASSARGAVSAAREPVRIAREPTR